MSENKVRTSQLLVPFGIGQIINFPGDVSLMVGGLNLWDKSYQQREEQGGTAISFSRNEFLIEEPRLSQRLGVRRFYSPFAWKENAKINPKIPIYSVRFPRWHYCTGCGTMRFLELSTPGEPQCQEADCIGRPPNRKKMLPVRFVAVCPNGHIDDVPFMKWVHRGDIVHDNNHKLIYKITQGSGDLSGILITCTCGDRRTLSGITRTNALNNLTLDEDDNEENLNMVNQASTCTGKKPWLGNVQPEGCNTNLQVVLRGASNVHFANIVSSIYLPNNDVSQTIAMQVMEDAGIENIRPFYEMDRDNHTVLRAYINTLSQIQAGIIERDFLLGEILERLNPQPDAQETNEMSEELFRYQEYLVFTRGAVTDKRLITKIFIGFNDYVDQAFLSNIFERVVLLEKLRETQVFTGFTRWQPQNGLSPIEKMQLLSNENIAWLPANVVFGEGIFLEFKNDKIHQWLNEFGLVGDRLIQSYHEYKRNINPDYVIRSLSPEFVMMHTFAHLLIKRLCYNCGYGSSSLKERIYYSDLEETRMHGILIYTSSSDSEGSMGGLVNQGRKAYLANNIKEAIEDARWCSADPVCMDVGIRAGQGPGGVNGAACHNCAIVSETSCEEFNMLLDRSTLIGTINNPEIGFFNLINENF